MQIERYQHKILFTIESSLYSEAVIHKCFYWYLSKFQIEIQSVMHHYQVTVDQISLEVDQEHLIAQIKKNLVDYHTREIITRETIDIRTLLVVKAFAHDDAFDDMPGGDLNDTVGFSASDFK
ncbi:His-Xaa-Ser system protein HxsD [Sphingobacterium bambusae]|uniref:His-Xaa-Ser system protein HxsD n=1 Tax=Sphingobacterium bambusae TaxID=662858 RepID=A0ABW6BJT7_9SPHI|nr:His-Xaa-Ser system protein HxsD [Sphingobacterium bambusae]WPL49361.1 His-Xaa-Ser system protein HxsD [Sphingobacterium bambusae]